MKKNTTILFCSILIGCLFLTGCIFVVAGVGALGGYAISKDTIQGEADRNFDSLWEASLDILNIMGLVYTEHKSKGIIEAKIDSSDVRVIIEEITSRTARLRVSARKYLLPNINLAQKLYIKIMQNSK